MELAGFQTLFTKYQLCDLRKLCPYALGCFLENGGKEYLHLNVPGRITGDNTGVQSLCSRNDSYFYYYKVAGQEKGRASPEVPLQRRGT